MLLSAMLVLLFSCEKSGSIKEFENMAVTVPFVLDNSMLISAGDCAGNSQSEIYVCFESIESDSRCPTGAICIWEGDAAAKFKFALKGEKTIEFTLHTAQSMKADTTAYGYKFTLKNVVPYPSLNNIPVKTDYKAEILIEKSSV